MTYQNKRIKMKIKKLNNVKTITSLSPLMSQLISHFFRPKN